MSRDSYRLPNNPFTNKNRHSDDSGQQTNKQKVMTYLVRTKSIKHAVKAPFD